MTREPIQVLRVIARLNIGGPAIQAISLTALMQDRGYATRLVRGSESADEGTMDDLARRMGVEPTLVASMRRDPGPGDGRALAELVRIARRDRAARRARVRAEWGVGDEAVVTLVARLVPIKRVDRFLESAALLRGRPDTRFVVVGDGELRAQLEASEPARALGDRLVWAGFRRDMPDVCFASDVVALTSDNEGTPVSLIEAQAAGTVVVSTNVGGVRSVVLDGETRSEEHTSELQS